MAHYNAEGVANLYAQDLAPGMLVRTLLHQEWRTVATVRVGRDRVALTFIDGAEAGLGRYHRPPVKAVARCKWCDQTIHHDPGGWSDRSQPEQYRTSCSSPIFAHLPRDASDSRRPVASAGGDGRGATPDRRGDSR